MYSAFVKLLNLSLAGSVMVLAIMLLRIVLKKAPKKLICILWALVALRLICPVSIASRASVFNFIKSTPVSQEQELYFHYSGHTEKPTVEFRRPVLPAENDVQETRKVETKTSDLYLPVVINIWLFGALLMIGSAAWSYWNLRKRVSASISFSEDIRICDEIDSPFILGIIKPVIYLPSGLDEKMKESVLSHERAHLRRFDHLWKPFGYLILSIYWFQPVIWIAYILFCRDIEGACDEKVISQLDKKEIALYSEALLVCALNRRAVTACPVAFGETSVKGRIKNIMKYKKPSFWIISIAVISCLALAVGFLTDPVKTMASSNEKPEQKLYTDYIGDAPTVVKIAQSLPYPKGYSYSEIELQTDEEPYVLEIFLTGKGNAEMEDWNICAQQAFDSIGNLNIVMFLSKETGDVLAIHAQPEELLWEEESLLADQELNETGSGEAISIIGGSDGPTSVFVAGKIGDNSGFETEEKELAVALTEELYSHKTDTIEDTESIYSILITEALNGHIPFYDFMITTEKNGNSTETLDITFTERTDDLADWEDNFGKTGNILLALVKDLQTVRFQYIRQGETEENKMHWDVKAANASLDEGTIKEYGTSEDMFRLLLDKMGYGSIPEVDSLGIQLSVKDVTPTGLTIVCTQDGTSTTGRLQTGTWYRLLKQNGDTWEEVDYVTDAIGWEDIALLIPNNDRVEWEINWEYLYGTLSPGQYCLEKKIDDFRKTGDYDSQFYSVTFEIEE